MQFGIRVGQQFKEFVNKGWDIDEGPQQAELLPSAYLQQVYDMTRILEIERNDLYREVDDLKRQLHLDYQNQCAELQQERDSLEEQKQQQDLQKAELAYIFDTQLDQIPDRQGVIDKLVQDNLKLIHELKENEILQNQQIQDYEDQIEALEQVNSQQKLIMSQFRNSVRVKLYTIQEQIQQIPIINVEQFDFNIYIKQIQDKYVSHIDILKRSFQNQVQQLTKENLEMNEELIEIREEYGSLTKILKQVRQSEDQLVEENEQLIQQVNNQIAQIKQLETQIQQQYNCDEDQQIEQLREEKIELQYDLEQKDLQVKELQSQILHLNNQSYLQEAKLDEELNQQINHLKLQVIKYQSEQTEYLLKIKQLEEQAPKEDDAWKIEDDDIDPWGEQSKQDDYLKLVEEHNELKEEYNSLSKVVQQIRKSEDQLIEDNTQLELKTQVLTQQLENADKKILDQDATMSYLRLEHNEMMLQRTANDDHQLQIIDLNSKLSQLQTDQEINAQDYSNLINKYTSLQAEYDDVVQKSAYCSKQNKDLHKAEEGLINENRSLLSMIQEQQNELDYLRSLNKSQVQEVLAINELRQIELKQEPIQRDANAWDFEQSLEVEEQSDCEQHLLEDHYNQIEDDNYHSDQDDGLQVEDPISQTEINNMCQQDLLSEEQVLQSENRNPLFNIEQEVHYQDNIAEPIFLENVISEEWQEPKNTDQGSSTPQKQINVAYLASEEKSQYQEDEQHSAESINSEFEASDHVIGQQLESIVQSDYPRDREQNMIKKQDPNVDPIERSECPNFDTQYQYTITFELESQIIESKVDNQEQLIQQQLQPNNQENYDIPAEESEQDSHRVESELNEQNQITDDVPNQTEEQQIDEELQESPQQESEQSLEHNGISENVQKSQSGELDQNVVSDLLQQNQLSSEQIINQVESDQLINNQLNEFSENGIENQQPNSSQQNVAISEVQGDQQDKQVDENQKTEQQQQNEAISIQQQPQQQDHPNEILDELIDEIEPWGETIVNNQLEVEQEQEQIQNPQNDEPEEIDELEDIDPWGNI